MDRRKHAAVHLRMLAEGEFRLRPRVLRLFRAQAREARKTFEEVGLQAALNKIDEDTRFSRLLQAHYARIIKVFARYTRAQIKPEVQRGAPVFEDLVSEFIRFEALRQANFINQNTKVLIRNILFKGEEKGLGVGQIAAEIRKEVGEVYGAFRASMIARTETHSAATFGSQALAESTGLEMEKEWVTSVDGRERDSHKDVDRDRTELRGKFFVGNEYIQRPGEGGPDNRINCRCSLIYHPKI